MANKPASWRSWAPAARANNPGARGSTCPRTLPDAPMGRLWPLQRTPARARDRRYPSSRNPPSLIYVVSPPKMCSTGRADLFSSATHPRSTR
jgi:hypothetical protein